jgi:NAD(P)-dependent dehydrogenase (short-subunit alcohol dehydrogenase family)
MASISLHHDVGGFGDAFPLHPGRNAEYVVLRVPMARPGRPEEGAAMIAWLASEACSFTTGAAFDRGVAAR